MSERRGWKYKEPLGVILLTCLLLSCGCSSTRVPYRALYLDLDGTALGEDHQVSKETAKAVDEYREAGGRIGIATGRILEQALPAIQALSPDLPVILFNGSVLYSPTTKAFTVLDTLEVGVAKQVAKMLNSFEGIDGYITHYAEISVASNSLSELRTYAESVDIHLADSTRVDLAGSVLKIVIVCPQARSEDVRQEVASQLPPTARVVISSPRTVEVLPAETNKAHAIRVALDQMGLRLIDAVAFGDSGNDVEMLSEVGLGVAMCNGREETKESADVLICTNDTDAVAKFIRFLLRCGNIAAE